jgi:hypothetical protein
VIGEEREDLFEFLGLTGGVEDMRFVPEVA